MDISKVWIELSSKGVHYCSTTSPLSGLIEKITNKYNRMNNYNRAA